MPGPTRRRRDDRLAAAAARRTGPAVRPAASPDSSPRPVHWDRCESCLRCGWACDGVRPACRACRFTGFRCAYAHPPEQAEAPRQVDPVAAVIQALQNCEPDEADEIIFHINQGTPLAETLRRVLGPPAGETPHLMFRYKMPYDRRQDMPPALDGESNEYLNTIVYKTALSPVAVGPEPEKLPLVRVGPAGPEYSRPYDAADLDEAKIDEAEPSRWTDACGDDVLMRRLLRLYFLREYQWSPCFHKDHFLNNMESGATGACSSLLVNAVLALACHCSDDVKTRHEHWDPTFLGYRFLKEAEAQIGPDWTVLTPSLTTVQAMMVLSVLHNLYSEDTASIEYARKAVHMAERLDLFGTYQQVQCPELRRACGHTAWCLYNLTSMQAFQLVISPPLVRQPPATPLPDPDDDPSWYGEFWLRYPVRGWEAARRMQNGHTFKSKSELVVIVNRLGPQLFFDERGDAGYVRDPMSLLTTYVELVKWRGSLPACLRAFRVVFPAQFKLHILYQMLRIYCAVAFINLGPERIAALPERFRDPRPLFLDAMSCFETVMRVYYLCHGFEHSDSAMLYPLAFMALMATSQIRALRFMPAPFPGWAMPYDYHDALGSLRLATAGLGRQRQCYFQGTAMLVGVLRQVHGRDAAHALAGAGINSWWIFHDIRRISAPRVDSHHPLLVDVTRDPRGWRLKRAVQRPWKPPCLLNPRFDRDEIRPARGMQMTQRSQWCTPQDKLAPDAADPVQDAALCFSPGDRRHYLNPGDAGMADPLPWSAETREEEERTRAAAASGAGREPKHRSSTPGPSEPRRPHPPEDHLQLSGDSAVPPWARMPPVLHQAAPPGSGAGLSQSPGWISTVLPYRPRDRQAASGGSLPVEKEDTETEEEALVRHEPVGEL